MAFFCFLIIWGFQVGFCRCMSGTWAGMAGGPARTSVYTWPLHVGWVSHGEKGLPKRGSLEREHCERTRWKPHGLFQPFRHILLAKVVTICPESTEGTQTPPLIGRVPKKSGAMFYNHHTDHMSMTAPKLRDNIQSHKWVRHGVVSHLVGEEGGVAPANSSSLSFQHLESTLPQGRHPGGVSPANSASQMKRSLLLSS